MYKNKKAEIAGIVITIIILILIVVFSNSDREISFLENAASKLVMPVQNGLTYLKNKISSNDTFFTDINTLKEENQDLKKKNSELEQSLRELENIKSENETLKEYLGLTEKYGEYKTIPAYIINKDISNYAKTIVINVGSDNGIQEKMTVIANEGLVGYIVSTTAKTAKIQTIVDSASATSCLASSTRDTMICKGTIENKSILSASNIATDARIIQGDSVETSGLGGIYLKGIHVGKIKKVNTGSNKTDSYATIETAVDFEKLETVLIITNQ